MTIPIKVKEYSKTFQRRQYFHDSGIEICKVLLNAAIGEKVLHTFIALSTFAERTDFEVVRERGLEVVTVQVSISVEVCKTNH